MAEKTRVYAGLAVAAVLALSATQGCAGDDATGATGATEATEATSAATMVTATTAGETDATSTTAATTTGGEAMRGWERVYADGGVGIDCMQSAAAMADAGAPSLSFGDATLVVGFEQLGDNQNPVVARFDGGAMTYCERHETEAPDGRAVGLTWDGGPFAYVVYTVVGGGTSLEGKGGWIPSYAPGALSGGGPKVSVVGRVAVDSGALERATFIIAAKSDNKVNGHSPRGAVTVLAGGVVEFLGASAHKPIDADLTAMDCTDYPFDARYRLSADLTSLVCADCSNCVSQSPCD